MLEELGKLLNSKLEKFYKLTYSWGSILINTSSKPLLFL